MKLGISLIAGVLVASMANAQIFVDRPQRVQGRPGMDITAHWEIPNNWDCPCDPLNLRWIQHVHVTDNAGNDKMLGAFPANFCDPLPGQSIGNDYNGNAQTGDTDPWYDVTRRQAARTGAFARGAGAFFEDGPGGPGFNNNAPIRVDFTTAVVCIDPNTMTFIGLGAFTWGFSIPAKNAAVNVFPVMETGTDGLINLFNNDIENNTSIDGNNTKFTQWRMITNGDPNCKLGLVMVPEPSSLLVLVGAGVGMMVRRRRAKAA